MTSDDLDPGRWVKSSRSNGTQDCVEVNTSAAGRDLIGVRDSKDQGRGPVLLFTRAEWAAFLAGARDGEFALPT
jgi:hypothetical protein